MFLHAFESFRLDSITSRSLHRKNNANSSAIGDMNDFQRNGPRNGVLPAYLSLLDEAYQRADEDYETSHTRGDRGIVIGPTEGEFKHTVKGLRNARRIRNILNGTNSSVKIALMTSNAHIEIR
jgi:hypothetical protein